MNSLRILSALLLASNAIIAAAQDAQVDQITPPKVLKSYELEWPGAVDREALVYLEFTIGLDGHASDISVVNEGFHEKRFADAAIRVLRKTRFSPKKVNGVPTPAYGMRMPVRFAIIGQRKGVTEDFKGEVLKVSRLIDEKDFAGAHFHAQWMLSEKVTLLFEYAVLQATMANTYARVGERHAALIAAQKATARSASEIQDFMPGAPIAPNSPGSYLLNKEMVLQLLELRMILAASLGFSVEALEAYSELAGLRDIPAGDRLAKAAEQLTKLVLSDQPLVANAKLDDDGNWTHRPFRHIIAIRNVRSGALSDVGLACKGSASVLKLKLDSEWTISDSPNACVLRFDGGPGTMFQIIETVASQESVQPPSRP